jgi:hypothetical protein
MAARLTPQGLQELLPEIPVETGSRTPSLSAAPSTAKVQRRGRDAVLEAGDVEIVVYELFPDRA